jgi:hypothetical protein
VSQSNSKLENPENPSRSIDPFSSNLLDMAVDLPEGSRGQVWMLDTFGNVHSLVNACKQLGFKVNSITDPKQLETAEVPPSPGLPDNRKSSFAALATLDIVWVRYTIKLLYQR